VYNCAVARASVEMLKKVALFADLDGAGRGTIGPGDYFGKIALLTGSERTATITAASDMLCYGMTPWDSRPLVESNSAIAWELLTAMAEKVR